MPFGAQPDRTQTSPADGSGSAVLRFALSGIAVLLLVGIVSTLLLRNQSEQEALRGARERTRILGEGVVEPLLTPALVEGDPESLSRLDEVVSERILGDNVVRVKIWTRDGRIIYSDERRLIGSRYPLGEDDLEAFETGRVDAELSDLDDPENRFEREEGELLEVYMALWTTDGEQVLFETYLPSETIAHEQRRLFLQLLPLLLAALILLWITQLPLVRSMSHRLKQGQLERENLLRRAIESSDTERRRVAHDLHDGVIQDLAGLSYELAAAADISSRSTSSELTGKLHAASAAVRRSIRQLRSLLIDVYPPNLHASGLPAALRDLASSIQARGIEIEMEIPEEMNLPPQTEALLFRVTQESVRNAMEHSSADSIRLSLTRVDGKVCLRLTDDGVGFSTNQLESKREEGHVGLRLLEELTAHSGGELKIQSTPGGGTTIQVEVPTS